MLLCDIMIEIEELAFGSKGIITKLRNGHQNVSDAEKEKLCELFYLGRIELSKIPNKPIAYIFQFNEVISALRVYAEFVPWTKDLEQRLFEIIH